MHFKKLARLGRDWGLGIGDWGSGIGQSEHAIRAKRGNFARAVAAHPFAETRATVALVERLVDDDVCGGGIEERLPGSSRPARRVFQRLGEKFVLDGRPAAVAVDEGFPMGRR